jgi:Fe-Mn family superoxide dismutase
MARTPKNYEYLIGNVKGLSEKMLRAHFELYNGYVKKIVEIEEKLKTADPKTANYSFGEVSELLRRRAVAYNGANLHELYFENLTGKESTPSGKLSAAIDQNFGSYKNWFEEVRAGLISSPGWVLLVRSRQDGLLRNTLITEHHTGVLVEQDIVLSLDGWEHAYFIDYATKKADYIATIEKAIDWSVAAKRFESAQGHSS